MPVMGSGHWQHAQWMVVLLPSCIQGSAESRTTGSPNLLLILTDDLGYNDVGFNGGSIPTPNIDSIADAGVLFSQAYSSSAVCGPSRNGQCENPP